MYLTGRDHPVHKIVTKPSRIREPGFLKKVERLPDGETAFTPDR
jgi:hypothetical protein